MASLYSTNLKLELIGTGDQSGLWGGTTNTNIGTALEQAIVGKASLVTGDFAANVATLTLLDTNASQTARAFVLDVTATLSAAGTINVPAIQKPYLVFNNTVGGFALTVKVSGLTGVVVPNGKRMLVYNNGTDVIDGINYLNGVATNLAGGSDGVIPYQSAPGVTGFSAAGTAGQALLSGGTGAPTWGTLSVGSGGTGATTLTGIVKGTGTTAFTAATAGTDYVAPSGALGTPSSGTLTNCTKDGTNGVGYLNIPQNSQSAAYTLVLADQGKHILHPSADTTARIFTIPANASVAFPIGTAVTFVNQNAAGVMTIAITTDVIRLAGAGTTGSRTLAANGVATAIKLTATEWIISGGSGLT